MVGGGDPARFDGEVALVTGGAGILGRRFCAGLAAAGAKVAVVDISSEQAAAVAGEIGEAAAPFACDVSDPLSVRACVEAVADRFGGVHRLLHKSGPQEGGAPPFFPPVREYRVETRR